jgi:hypothetical protein
LREAQASLIASQMELATIEASLKFVCQFGKLPSGKAPGAEFLAEVQSQVQNCLARRKILSALSK